MHFQCIVVEFIMETTLNFEKVWQLFQETNRQFKETNLEFKEMQRSWDHSFQEMRREFQASQQALDRKFQETDRRFKETDRKMKALQELFEGQWDKLVESLVEGDLVRLLDKRGIQVNDASTRRKGCCNGENYEFDIIAHNGEEIVIVEVKTTLRAKPVGQFIERLQRAKHYLPEYRTYRVFGAMAYLRVEQASDQYA